VLRLHEPGSGGSAASSAPLPGPDPSSVSEKLPVVPLPRRAAAQKQADVQPMQEYQSALAKYRAGDSAAAADAFRGFFQRYAHHAYADNALYWLAECSYDLKSYQVALKLFRQVVEQYPSGNKAPDALLKMALCYVQLKDKKNARTILGQVVESYPRSQVAKLASVAMAKL
jgi:tol-pal system protein YbgF